MDDLYKIVFNTIQEGLILTDMEGVICNMNPRTENLFGYTKEELIGQKIEVLIPKEHREGHVKTRNAYQHRPVNRQMGSGMTLYGLRKNGSTFPLEISLNSFFDAEGKRYVSALISDIYIRKRAQDEVLRINENLEKIVNERTQELYENTQLMESITRYFPTGAIYVLNLDYTITFADGMEFNRIQQDPEALIGEDYILINEANRRALLNMLNNLIEYGAVQSQIISKGTEYYRVSASLLNDTSNKLRRILIVENNITPQKKTQEALEKTVQEQTRLNELKSRFVSFASHEFRTPLTTINSSADLIKKYAELDNPERILKHTDRIQQSVDYLTSLLNDFLSLEKIESGIIKIKIEKINLMKLLEECVEESLGWRKTGQSLQSSCDVDYLSTDPFLLKSIVINLLSNAYKYTPEHGIIRIEAKSIQKELRLSIMDNGIGIPETELMNLFTRFFRASNAQNEKGTGLGLHIVARHIELLKGKITCESKEREGTKFVIHLPQHYTN